MTIKVLGLHHHALRSGPDALSAGKLHEFYAEVLGMPCAPLVPGDSPGQEALYALDLGEQGRIHLDPSGPLLALTVDELKALVEEHGQVRGERGAGGRREGWREHR